jgi:hypothetical protein
MSPREKHVPDDASRTSVCLTAEDRGAIHWISQSRRNRKDKRTTGNDILIDALWYYLQKTEGVDRERIKAGLPPAPVHEVAESKITQMPKPKSGR